MALITEKEQLKSGLIIFRRGDVEHRNFYCRVRLAKEDRYKTISLRTADRQTARDQAFDLDAEIRFKLKHDVPVFNRPFRDVAEEYITTIERRANNGVVSAHRVKCLKNWVRRALDDYVGSTQVHLIGQDRWAGYPTWRRENGKGRHRALISDSTIASEMGAFNAVMNYAISKRYVPASHRFEGKPKLKTMRRDAFTAEEYRKLHSVGRKWVKEATIPRAYLENLRESRARGGRLTRTMSRDELEKRLDALIRQQGEAAANRLRDDGKAIAPQLGYEAEAAELNELIGSLLGTRDGDLSSAVGKARHAGQPFDPDRTRLFETLFAALRDTFVERRPAPERDGEASATLAFFEAYFSNFIEGTEFTVEEAAEIVFEGVIPQERPADAHDVLGTFRVVSDLALLKVLPSHFTGFRDLLRRRHASVMEARPDKAPGAFKERENRAGNTVLVAPDLVDGTLERGFEFLQALDDPFQRAVYMMVLIAEVHPFTDGNGRIARIMMNAELVARDQERIIIPTAYRTDYLGALKAFSHNGLTDPLIRMLDVAQSYTHRIDWTNLERARADLAATNAFAEGSDAKLKWG